MSLPLPQILLELLAQSPSMQAAIKAGRKAEISAVVFKACGTCEPCTLRARARALGAILQPVDAVGPCTHPRDVRDLGTVSLWSGSWQRHLPGWVRTIARVWGQRRAPTSLAPGQVHAEVRSASQIIVRFVTADGKEIERANF